MPIKNDRQGNRTVHVPLKCFTPPETFIVDDSGIANKTLVATYYSADYVTITTSRGLELYDKSCPQRLICIYPGERFIIDSSDDDMEIYRF
jgi:hypothetical protein